MWRRPRHRRQNQDLQHIRRNNHLHNNCIHQNAPLKGGERWLIPHLRLDFSLFEWHAQKHTGTPYTLLCKKRKKSKKPHPVIRTSIIPLVVFNITHSTSKVTAILHSLVVSTVTERWPTLAGAFFPIITNFTSDILLAGGFWLSTITRCTQCSSCRH